MASNEHPLESSAGSRRLFLKQAACSAVGYSAILSTVFDLFKVNAAAQVGGDFKALVCLFLYGGNDSNNLIVPRGAEYGAYAAARGSLALPLDQVLPITPLNSDGREWALHPNCPELQALFGQGALALMCNVGPLMAPTTREQYQAGTVEVPPSLFSHDDQQHLWQTSVNEMSVQTGWGGRTGDLVRSLNTNPAVSMMISLAGANIYQVGRDVFQYQVSSNGAAGIESYKLAPDPDPESRALDRILAREYSNIFENAYRDTVKKALDGDLRFHEAAHALARARVVATLLPIAAFYLKLGRYAPARALIDAGVAVALATDVNPGGGFSPSMPFAMTLACFAMNMTLEEALVAATLNAAYSLDRHDRVGSLEVGKQMDAVIVRGDLIDLVRVGVGSIVHVVKKGVVVI